MTTAAEIDTALEACLDRTACLVPDVQVFTSGGTWAKPAHALFVDFVLVGSGGGGAAAAVNRGGGGGGAGGTVVARMPAASVPASLVVYVGAAGAAGTTGVTPPGKSSGDGGDGDYSYTNTSGSVYDDPFSLIAQGGIGGHNAVGGVAGYEAGTDAPVLGHGGAGGATASEAGAAGTRGPMGGGGGRGGGYPTELAQPGCGYGGGGAGGCTTSITSEGGGGGGGYGATVVAPVPNSSSSYNGWAGAPGVVVITTWRGVAL